MGRIKDRPFWETCPKYHLSMAHYNIPNHDCGNIKPIREKNTREDDLTMLKESVELLKDSYKIIVSLENPSLPGSAELRAIRDFLKRAKERGFT